MFDGLVMFGNAVVGYLNPLSLALAFGATCSASSPAACPA